MNYLPSPTIYSCKKYSMYSFENIFFPQKIMIYEVGYLLMYFAPYFIHTRAWFNWDTKIVCECELLKSELLTVEQCWILVH